MMQNRKQWLTAGGLALAAVVFFAVNIFSSATFTGSRLDLTENNLYTLTEGTRNIIDRLEEPVTLRLFLSQDAATRLPGISAYAQRVRELLAEYERQSDGLIDLRIIDPEPFSEDEDRAVAYGLRGVTLDDAGTILYFGLVGTGATDEQEVIPFFAPNREELLEYDLTQLVYQLSNPKPLVVGLMSSLPIGGGAPAMPGRPPSPAWVVVEQMRELFEVRQLEADGSPIPEDVDVLMLVHPRDLDEATLYAIDQFVLGGGRAMVFVDPNMESDRGNPMLGGAPPSSSDLQRLFAQWGVELVKEKVAADLRFAERVRFADQQRQATAEYPVWINLQPSQFDAGDVATAELGNLIFATSGYLQDLEKEGITVTPLVRTSDDAAEFDAAKLQFVSDPRVLLREYQPVGAPLTLAARIAGKVQSAFPDGPPAKAADAGPSTDDAAEKTEGEKDPADAPARAEHLSESTEPINVIVVADVDMLSDGFWVQVQNLLGTRIFLPTASNGAFVINALESLAGSNDLISVRSRGQYTRPFTKVAEIQRDAELKFRQKEEELLARLADTEAKLVELEQGKQQDQAMLLNDAQRAEIERFREEKLKIRKDLRDVRHQLHKDIEGLESWTKFMNIGLMPIIIGIGGIVVGVQQTSRRKRKQS